MDAVSVNGSTGAQFHLPTEEDLMKCFEKYDMTHEKRGVAYIFNMKNFSDPKLQTRHGSSKDTKHLKRALENLGFHEDDINICKDFTAKEMLGALEEFDLNNPKINIDCFVCAILSHGGKNDIICGYEGKVELDELLSCLRPDRCPSLTGVPKLIFIQACRGSKIDVGVEKNDAAETESERKSPKIPIMADMLVFHSSYNKHPSIRNEDKGSWFMQTLSTVLMEHGTDYEIMKLLTAVCKRVASFEFKNPDNPECRLKRKARSSSKLC
eukprot:XP_014783524.1 PREDICTED: caspase-like [Octopus bimaculoides]